jgi:ADP-ribosyl-[dinitrogen reductase] hydrolase
MARNLWLSLIAFGGNLEVHDVLSRHLRWLAGGPPKIDGITRRVLDRVGALTPGEEPNAAREYVEQRGPEVSAGNGSVKYCAPLGVAYARRAGELELAAPALSAITHWDQRCRTACLAVTLAVAALVRGEIARDAVVASIAAVVEREGGEELEYLVAEAGRARAVNGPDRGLAFFAAGLGLQVVGEGRGFDEGLRHVVSLGGDTASNAAVAGALLGAAHGRRDLPSGRVTELPEGTAIESEAEQLAELI